MKQINSKIIISLLSKAGKKGMPYHLLKKIFTRGQASERRLRKVLTFLLQKNEIVKIQDRYYLVHMLPMCTAVITENRRHFCYAQDLEGDKKFFISGKYSKGAIAGDRVLITPLKSKGKHPEGKVVSFLSLGEGRFSGVLQLYGNQAYVLPDHLCDAAIMVEGNLQAEAEAGAKVVAKVVKRGETHQKHTCEILLFLGSSEEAFSCCKSYLEIENIAVGFSKSVICQARKLAAKPPVLTAKRLDLRNEIIFTIDSEHARDLDDAISVKKIQGGYLLGIHIADVSYYVRQGTLLNQEAFKRGCSIYYADQVIPMLPRELSNGICSLSPHQDRYCFSAFLYLDHAAHLVKYHFSKTMICSKVKGVYKEINALLQQKADRDIIEKYREILPALRLMYEVYQKRRKLRKARGALEIASIESDLSIDDKTHKINHISQRTIGPAEELIEEFMLLANEAAASFAKREKIPFIFRVHEPPNAEKMENLREIAGRFNIAPHLIKNKMHPKELNLVLNSQKDRPYFMILNQYVLRNMSKARYDTEPMGHYALVLQNYAHFTSPIRRYPDLVVHQILAAYLEKGHLDKISNDFVESAAGQASACERKAIEIERKCESFYQAEYMLNHIGEEFLAVITSVIKSGFFVILPNTVEGFVSVHALSGKYLFDGISKITDAVSGKKYEVGQTLPVICARASVNDGTVDFVPKKIIKNNVD